MNDTTNEVEVRFDALEYETNLAWKIRIGEKTFWLPKSQVELDEDECIAMVPEWMAIEKELV